MSRFVRCDQCRKEIDVNAIMDTDDLWPCILTASDEPDPSFCGWSCLADYAAARVLIESAGES